MSFKLNFNLEKGWSAKIFHDSFYWPGSKTIYIDPWDLPNDDFEAADLIFITHEHDDHCDPKQVEKLLKDDTIIITEPMSFRKLKEAGIEAEIITVKPKEEKTVKGIKFKTIASYNLDKEFHPKKNQWLGFIITMDGTSIYHPGDSDFIPEMSDLRPDIALLPVSGTYVMTADEAYQAALAIKPKLVIPIHYNKIVGDMGDALRLAKLLDGEIPILIC